MPARPTPDGYTTVTPWIVSRDTAKLLEFITAAFDGVELARIVNPDGAIGHAEARIGDSIVMMFDAGDGWPETPAFIRLFVDDCDAVHRQAVQAGAQSITEVTAMFFGDRVGRVCDPLGNVWWLQTHVEDVSFDEMGSRAQEAGAIEAMTYVQRSLDAHMKERSRRPH